MQDLEDEGDTQSTKAVKRRNRKIARLNARKSKQVKSNRDDETAFAYFFGKTDSDKKNIDKVHKNINFKMD